MQIEHHYFAFLDSRIFKSINLDVSCFYFHFAISLRKVSINNTKEADPIPTSNVFGEQAMLFYSEMATQIVFFEPP